jgi:hypothetical protein
MTTSTQGHGDDHSEKYVLCQYGSSFLFRYNENRRAIPISYVSWGSSHSRMLSHNHALQKVLTSPEDGLYRVVTPYLCAGFVVKGGRVIRCAPILRSRLAYWMRKAKFVA